MIGTSGMEKTSAEFGQLIDWYWYLVTHVLPPCQLLKAGRGKRDSYVHPQPSAHLRRVLDHRSLQTLGVLDVHRLHVAVQLLLGALLIVTLPRYPDPQAEWHALDPGLPDLLVQLRVEADVVGALRRYMVG